MLAPRIPSLVAILALAAPIDLFAQQQLPVAPGDRVRVSAEHGQPKEHTPQEASNRQSARLAGVVRDSTLENGLLVIVARTSSVPIATIEIVVRSGAFTQLEELDEGLPHVLEHMLFEYFERRGRGWGYYTSELDATSNAATGQEAMRFYLTLPSEHLDDGIELLCDLVRSPRFKSEPLRVERLVVRGEIERQASDAHALADLVTDMVLWGPAFRQKNPAGNILTINTGVTTERLEEHHERYFVPNNAALIVTGDVEAADAFKSAEKHFGRWKRGDDPFADFAAPPIAPLAGDSVFVVSADASGVTFMIRWHGPAVSEDRDASFAADVFSELVNQPTSGTQRRLVDTGLFTNVFLSYVTRNNVGPIQVEARTTFDKLGEASAALLQELDLMGREDYFNEADLETAKKRLRVTQALSQQSAPGLAHGIAYFWSAAGLDYFREYFDALAAQTADDVRRYVAQYIAGRPKVVSLLMSQELRRSNLGRVLACLDSWRAP
ncbi:MAG: insulinase family protein [Gemmatimonadota bacterium]|nr:MAG: insulinase family protein [Gemmatimonadota bacterium]